MKRNQNLKIQKIFSLSNIVKNERVCFEENTKGLAKNYLIRGLLWV